MKFVFDLDGTICFQGVPVSEQILSSLENLVKKGHEVIFASARPIRDLLPILHKRFHQFPMIGGNGSIVDKEIHRMVKGLEVKFGVTCDLTYVADYPPLHNDAQITKEAIETLQNANDPLINEISVYPMLSGSEDFAYYLEKVPGTFLCIGCKPKNVEVAHFNHHPKFDIDEDALLVAAKAIGHVVCSYSESL